MRTRLFLSLLLAGLLAFTATATVLGQVPGPALNLTGAKKQDAKRRVSVKVQCLDQDCTATATGRIKLSGGKSSTVAAKGALKLRPVTKEIAARIAIKLKPKITQRGHRAVRKTLKQGGTAKAKVTITAVGANGATSVGKRNVVLRLG